MTLMTVVKAASTHNSDIKTVPLCICFCLHFACRSTCQQPDLG